MSLLYVFGQSNEQNHLIHTTQKCDANCCKIRRNHRWHRWYNFPQIYTRSVWDYEIGLNTVHRKWVALTIHHFSKCVQNIGMLRNYANECASTTSKWDWNCLILLILSRVSEQLKVKATHLPMRTLRRTPQMLLQSGEVRRKGNRRKIWRGVKYIELNVARKVTWRCRWNVGHRSIFSNFSTVRCCRLHLSPAVLVSCYPHYLLQISLFHVFFIVPEIIYYVSGGALNFTHSLRLDPGVLRSSSSSVAMWYPLEYLIGSAVIAPFRSVSNPSPLNSSWVLAHVQFLSA